MRIDRMNPLENWSSQFKEGSRANYRSATRFFLDWAKTNWILEDQSHFILYPSGRNVKFY